MPEDYINIFKKTEFSNFSFLYVQRAPAPYSLGQIIENFNLLSTSSMKVSTWYN